MKKSTKRIITASSLAVLALSLAACGGTKESKESKSEDGSTKLLMYQIGDKPENMDKLMEIANKRIKEKTGATLDMQYIGWGDWDQKMSTIISSGENYDISFVRNYVANSQKGAYANITDLAKEKAKDAYDQLDPAYIQGNLIDGKLYGFPVNANVFSQQVLTFNKEYLDKYNIDISGINSYQDATEVLKKFHEKEPNIAAFAIGQSFSLSPSSFDYLVNKDFPFAISLEGDSTKIINQYSDPAYMKDLKTMREWYEEGFIPTDAATSNTEYPMEGNTWFMREETQGPMDYGDTALSNAAGKELVSRPITSPLKTTVNAQMANFSISNVSKNKEKAMEVIGLLNSDPELLNGLVWGVKDEAWEKLEGNKIKLLEGYKPNTHMAAWNTGNNKILYTQDTITDDMIAKRDDSIKNAKESPCLGFNFKTDKVKTEMTNISNVMNRYRASLTTGSVDPEETVAKLVSDLDKAGWKKVQEDMQKQYDEFLKSNK